MENKQKVLHLTLKKKWFDMAASGVKKEEYREIKQYWINRLYDKFDSDVYIGGGFKKYDAIQFKNEYGKNAPTMLVEFKGIDIGEPYSAWSDNWEGDVFRIKLGNILAITR